MKQLLALFFLMPLFTSSQNIIGPEQPTEGPGGADYKHQKVIFQDFAPKADGYWLFEPDDPKPDSAHIVVFNHGYGAYNPMIYGKWIKHIVRKGNIVIYPRYQKNLLTPRPNAFAKNAAKAINDALIELRKEGHIKPIVEPLAIVGHSYGGTISADLGVNFERYNIPQPKAIMLVSPGTSVLKGGRLKTYEGMPADTKLLITLSQHDHVVGNEFGELVFHTAIHTKERNLIRQYTDKTGSPKISAGHNESYSLDKDFDNGIRNVTAKRALSVSKLSALDYNGYWKLFDALLDYTKTGKNKKYVFGNTPEQKSLGNWSDGSPIRSLEIEVPEEGIAGQNPHITSSKQKKTSAALKPKKNHPHKTDAN